MSRVGRDRVREVGFPVTFILAAAVLGSCRMVGSSPGAAPPPTADVPVEASLAGRYEGDLSIEGGEIPVSLSLLQDGKGKLMASLQLPSELHATGQGERSGGGVRLALAYQGECPGSMTLVGRWDPASGLLTGVIRASDCTGSAEGTFRFARVQEEEKKPTPPRDSINW